MQLYPAIDMKGGKCVRLTQGLFDNVKVYSDTPADMAKLWVSQGASFLHIVDLDGPLYHRHPGSRTSGIYERTGGDVRTRPYCSWCGR